MSTSTSSTASTTQPTTIIVGAGIVGSCLASLLTSRGHLVTLIDRSISDLPGSTGHAPGYVGQYNSIPALTTLAVRTVAHYRTIPDAFDTVGGLEIASSDGGLKGLQERCDKAVQAGLSAEMVNEKQTVEKAPFFVTRSEGGLWFPNDGTANARLIASYEQQHAKQRGATFIDADVSVVEEGSVALKDGTAVKGDNIVVCAGIWTSSLLAGLPVVPVAHPYAYTADRETRKKKTPFVRYPEHHVYVRDHGTKDGIGSYGHDPIAVRQLIESAYGDWFGSFEGVLSDALSLLPNGTRDAFKVSPQKAGKERVFNGLFSVTPDGMPLVGKVKEGVYVAGAVWVTHAAGCAQLVADILESKVEGKDRWLVEQLHPLRFQGQDENDLQSKALSTYNDIYNKNAGH